MTDAKAIIAACEALIPAVQIEDDHDHPLNAYDEEDACVLASALSLVLSSEAAPLLYRDGSDWCARGRHTPNIAEGPVGFGASRFEALCAYQEAVRAEVPHD